ncbi:MAG: hypoxanthine phosphoribosyltransferase [Lachnospiraceae bacterium]|nr:hypoxanthine phosphoribosyltransferase [Lachnospiraceae bacterium]
MGETVKMLLTEEEVNRRITEVAEEINKDYNGEPIHMICILKGGVMFMCELAKRIKGPVSFDFMDVSSYGHNTESSGVIKILKDLDEDIEGRNVLLVEDIIDTGKTLNKLSQLLYTRGPKSIKICTMLDKPSRRVEKEVFVDYRCFQIPNKFVVGYGLDYNQKYRNLPYIGVVEFENE